MLKGAKVTTGNVHWSVIPLCVNVCVRKCLQREVNVCEDVRMYAVIFAMKLCGSVCVFFYNKIAMRKSSWSPKKNPKKPEANIKMNCKCIMIVLE